MRRISIAALFALVLALAAPALAQDTTTWEIDSAHTSAQFSVRHLMISNVRGEFSKITGTVILNEKDMTKSSVEVTIPTETINTREERRDTHLKSPDFLDIASHPAITFKSTSVAVAGKDRYKVTGDLTIRGVTKEVALDVTLTSPISAFGGVRRGAHATTTINRQDFGVSWNRALDGGGVVVGNDVEITIDAELNKKA